MIEVFKILVRVRGLQVLLPFLLFGILVMGFNWSPWLILAIAWGALVQWLVEYALHRFVYHGPPPSDQGAFNTLYRSHIVHHEFPSDPRFFFGDPGGDSLFALKVGLASFLLHALVLWPFIGLAFAITTACAAVFVGSIGAYYFYEYCHTLAHLNVPKGWLGKWVTRDHLAHHFQDHQATFHVSAGMGWIDRLFGTGFDKKKAKARFDPKTQMTIGIGPEDFRLQQAKAQLLLRPRQR